MDANKKVMLGNAGRYAWLLTFLILSGCTPGTVRFVQMADPQMGMFNENGNLEYEINHLRIAANAITTINPDFVIVCGDLTNKKGDSLQVVTFRRSISKISSSIPVFLLPGNHDVGNVPSGSSLELYHCLYGKDHYSFKKGPVYGIVLNSSLMRDDSLARDEATLQDQWLRKTLIRANRSGKQILVFMHHPLFVDQPGEPTGYENFPEPERSEYLELFKKYNVTAIFTGHLHKNRIIDLNGLPQITTAALSTNFGRDSSGFRLVTVGNKQWSQKYLSLDSLSKQLNLRK